jgi:acyl-CoA thioesterase FadM
VRFDEADAAGWLRPSGFLRFAQDVAWQHSEVAGFGRRWYAERMVHWLVRDVDLRILRPVTYGDQLSVSTEVTGWRHVWARRSCEIRRPSDSLDEPVATVRTDWVLLRGDGRPARLPSEMSAFLEAGRSFTRRRIELDATPDTAWRQPVDIRPSEVDPMGHLNNAAYLDLIDDLMASGRIDGANAGGRRYQVSYARPAVRGAYLEAACWPLAGGCTACRISDETGDELTLALIDPAEP